jgi:hypothetical protein
MQTTVRRQTDSTLAQEPLVTFDSTESPAPRTEQTGPRGGRGRKPPQPQPSALRTFLVNKWAELLIAGGVIWLFAQMYSLNREVGRLGTQFEDAKPAQERLEQQMKELENREREDMKRLEDRLDSLQPASTPRSVTPRRR